MGTGNMFEARRLLKTPAHDMIYSLLAVPRTDACLGVRQESGEQDDGQ